jgi:hypothetical protein
MWRQLEAACRDVSLYVCMYACMHACMYMCTYVRGICGIVCTASTFRVTHSLSHMPPAHIQLQKPHVPLRTYPQTQMRTYLATGTTKTTSRHKLPKRSSYWPVYKLSDLYSTSIYLLIRRPLQASSVLEWGNFANIDPTSHVHFHPPIAHCKNTARLQSSLPAIFESAEPSERRAC